MLWDQVTAVQDCMTKAARAGIGVGLAGGGRCADGGCGADLRRGGWRVNRVGWSRRQFRAGLPQIPADESYDDRGAASWPGDHTERIPVPVRDADHPTWRVSVWRHHWQSPSVYAQILADHLRWWLQERYRVHTQTTAEEPT